MIWILDHQERLSLMLIFHFLLYALHPNMEYVIILCITEEAREIKNCSEISTLSRKWLHGSRAGPLFGCTLWYCGNKCKQSLLLLLNVPFFDHLVWWMWELSFPGTWYGQKTLYYWVLPFHWDAEWCCGGHCLGAWWGGTTFQINFMFHLIVAVEDMIFYLIIVWSVASTKAGLRLHQTYHCRPYYFLWSLL